MLYADVILPLPICNMFTYAIPEEMSGTVGVGCRVIVPFGARKFYTAVIVRVHHDAPQGFAVKPVLEALDASPCVLPEQLGFWHWMSEYYICAPGDVMKAAMPAGMRPGSESKVRWNADAAVVPSTLSERERCVADILLRRGEVTVAQLQRESGMGHVLSVMRKLMERSLAEMKEEVKRSFKPRTEICLRLNAELLDKQKLAAALSDLKRAPKQQALLLKFIELTEQDRTTDKTPEMSRRELLASAKSSLATCQALLEKGILEAYKKETGRLPNGNKLTALHLPTLSEAQEAALSQINEEFRQHRVCLLHGVTSSGKTEVYIHLMQQITEQGKQGKQVLFLVPEIVLTTQLTERLFRVFGTRMGVYHSKFSDAERVEVWQKQLSNEPYEIIVGVRSSLFLPFQRLGLVIIDEEHESSYKQEEPAPRYHARDAAIMLAHRLNALTLLGTATPAIETYHNATKHKYGLVQLSERYGNVQLPEIEVADIKELRRKRLMNGPFSPILIQAMRDALKDGQQIILFQNRRGYAPTIACHVCGWVPHCMRCDVSLTYHKSLNVMTCHYCGFTSPVPTKCPACEGIDLVQYGFGTEKVEDLVHSIFPDAVSARLDLDTARSRKAYESILDGFKNGKINILIGTQMVTKGLDFEQVGLVGILDADAMLNIPDFRSHERAFQLMEQVAGRAGRRNKRGRVILQTQSPDLEIINHVVRHDYTSFYNNQLQEREAFLFPPFCRLTYVFIKHKDAETAGRLATLAANTLRQTLGNRILGPDAPPVARIHSFYIRKIVIKLETGISQTKVRTILLHIRQQLLAQPPYHNALIYFDIDPM